MHCKSNSHISQLDEEQLSIFLNQIQFKVNAFGYWESSEQKNMSFSNEDFEIIYYVEGSSRVSVGKKVYDCPVHSLVLIEPYSLNTVKSNKSDNHAYYYIHFEIQPYHLQHQLLQLLTQHGHVFYEHEFRDFKEMFQRMLLEVQQQEMGYTSIVKAGLLRVVVEMIRAQQKRNKIHYPITYVDNQYVRIVNDAITHLKNHLQYSFKQQDLAKAVGVSTSYLYKAFQSVVQTSPTKYVQQYKLMRAQKLLLQNYRVNDIASMLGYSSAYHFSKVFKDHNGMSPKEYRNKARNEKVR